MTATDQQLRALAFLAKACRPTGARHWDEAGILAALRKCQGRNLAAVALATIRAAADRDVETPGVIPGPGSHWQESAAVVGVFVPEDPKAPRCSICGRIAGHHGFDHDFAHPQPVDPEQVAAKVAELRAELTPTAPRPEPLTREDFEAKNPRLHERLERVRQGLPVPKMREDEAVRATEEESK